MCLKVANNSPKPTKPRGLCMLKPAYMVLHRSKRGDCPFKEHAKTCSNNKPGEKGGHV